MKKFKNVIIFTHHRYLSNVNIKKITSSLKRSKVNVNLIAQYNGYVKAESSDTILEEDNYSKNKIIRNSDLVLVFGGDGLFLSASKMSVDLGIPILGINHGKIGFLVDIDKKNALKQVKDIINGNYLVDSRMLLDVELGGNGTKKNKFVCLNDVVIHNYGLLKMIQVKIFVNNYLINIQRSDGLIIATPTGSTAYSMSNGCPIVSPDSKVISLTPVSPHTYSHRPLIINDTDKIKIEIDSSSVMHTMATIDGSNNKNILNPEIVNIRKSKKTLKILHPKEYNYFQILNEKLKWGGRA